jgi:molecular chaperone GrpE
VKGRQRVRVGGFPAAFANLKEAIMKKPEREALATPPAEGEEAAAAAGAAEPLAAVVAERDQLASEKADLQDRLLRRLAEFENFRRRAEKEKAEIREFSAMETIRLLLPVIDDFERALKAGTADNEYTRGMELIFQRLSSELQKMGLEPLSTEGQKFDPHSHHALELRETSEFEDHAILEELQKGYNFRGKLLRPAMVTVAVAPSAGKQPEA